eukprot:TRINITY_DN1431_c0_g1_i4.p1 TRINITY_DN1431_c0_g1~~TRINITY_DN1431_c0_g1_i4.p1  ORF type:complete len:355 (-),score=90.98 TRINITY_DN1431_c0_g1_i4:800-1864(-)
MVITCSVSNWSTMCQSILIPGHLYDQTTCPFTTQPQPQPHSFPLSSSNIPLQYNVTASAPESVLERARSKSRHRAASMVEGGNILKSSLDTSFEEQAKVLDRAVKDVVSLLQSNGSKTQVFHDKAMESTYNKNVAENNVAVIQFLLVMALSFHTLFGIQDIANAPDSLYSLFLSIRIGIGLPLFLMAYSISKTPLLINNFQRTIVSISSLILTATVALAAAVANNNPSAVQPYIILIIRAILQANTSFSISVINATSLSTFFGIIVVIMFAFSMASALTSSVVILLAIFQVAASFTNYSLEVSRRTNFLCSQLMSFHADHQQSLDISNVTGLKGNDKPLSKDDINQVLQQSGQG